MSRRHLHNKLRCHRLHAIPTVLTRIKSLPVVPSEEMLTLCADSGGDSTALEWKTLQEYILRLQLFDSASKGDRSCEYTREIVWKQTEKKRRMHSRHCHGEGSSFSRATFNNESDILSRHAIVTHPLCFLRMRNCDAKTWIMWHNGLLLEQERVHLLYDGEEVARIAYQER